MFSAALQLKWKVGSVVVENAYGERSETYQHRRDHCRPGVID